MSTITRRGAERHRAGSMRAWLRHVGSRPKSKIFQLKNALAGIRPPMWRRVLVPGEITLAELHEVVQVAVGWTDTHLHEFEIGDARYGAPDPD
jgi:pRiA4b ORF-3-like protein